MTSSVLVVLLVVLARIPKPIEADLIKESVSESSEFPKETYNESSPAIVNISDVDSLKKLDYHIKGSFVTEIPSQIGSTNSSLQTQIPNRSKSKITSQNVDTINPEEMISDFVNTFGNESLIYLRNKSFNKTSTEKEIILDFLRDDNTNYCKNGFYNDWKRTGLEASDRLNLRQLPTSFQELLLDRLQDQLRQLFVGLPLDIAFSTLNYICSTIVDLGVVRSKIVPDVSRMSFLLRTEQECQNTSIPLTQAEELWNTPGFYQDRPTVLFITGWTTSINNSNSGPVAKAYACRNDTNILILDAADFIDTLYTWSALNTEVIGATLATALLRMNATYVTNHFHLVGHSLGAQIAGSAGRNYRQMSGGLILKRITGLDPANPCFYDGNDLEGLRSGDARFVDIIHSNPGMLGSPKRSGDADFFVQGRVPFKEGCEGLSTISCSHQRAVDYWTETVYPSNANDFLGRRCDRYSELLLGSFCRDTRTVMGYAAKPTDLGLFYVGANRAEPYGQNANLQTYTYSSTKCGSC
ncbi:probable phospholipase A1 magnifin [Drosophila suzukii]|uniref:Probable phospholipase A1 magnifin n=1 Tax=Drosophila suzukii TaxID=28584 RepID=A0AB40AE92_DROSZ